MNQRTKLVVVLDACVIYPAPIRDFLLHLSTVDLFQPKWTSMIQEEWKRNLLIQRPDIRPEQLQRTITEMNRAFPDADVKHFEPLIDSLTLPDANDRHVLAAGICCRANYISTFNLKDFPKSRLKPFDIEAISPDTLIMELIDQDQEKVLHAFQNQVRFLKNPPKTPQQVVSALLKCGLKKTSTWIEMTIEESLD